jgi:formylglycine-generating enzyme required for sulfatase activity
MFRKESWVILLSIFLFAGAVQAEDIKLDLQMPGTIFLAGSPFKLDLELTNLGPDYANALVFVALNVGTADYWFFPSWVKYPPDFDSEIINIQGFTGSTLNIIPEFIWPPDSDTFFNASFIAAVVSDSGELISNVPVVPFGWTAEPIVDSIDPASGPPGKFLRLTGRGFNLTSGDIKIEIDVYQFPVTATGVDENGNDYVITVIPPLDSGSYHIKLFCNGHESNTIPLFIEEPAPTGKPLGQVVDEMSQGMDILVTEINTKIIPDAVADGLIPSAAQADYEATINRANMIFSAFYEEIENLPDNQKQLYESILVQNGLDEIFSEITRKSGDQNTRDDLTIFYACIGLDTTSACLTAIDQAWSIVDLATIISAIISGGITLPAAGGSFGAHFAISILDATLDGFFPIDLKEIKINGVTGALPAYVNHEVTYTLQGAFDNQKAPLDATFGIFLASFLEGLGPFVPDTFGDQLRNWITGKLGPMGLSLGDSILGGDIMAWGDPPPVTLDVDFSLYEGIDLNQALAMSTMSFGVRPMLDLMTYLNMGVFPETGVTIGNSSMLDYELQQEKLMVTGKAVGNTSLTLNAFSFTVLDKWWNFFSVEVPGPVTRLQEVEVEPRPDFTPTPIPTPTNFVFIPGGSFVMGSAQDELCHSWIEYPEHSVSLTQGYYMQQTEVTQQQWLEMMEVNPSQFSGMDRPVERASWWGACVYCNRLSVAAGLRPCYYLDESFTVILEGSWPFSFETTFWDQSANGFRLPTEAEWEFACRAGTTTPYSNGLNNTTCGEDPNVDPLAWYYYNADNQSHNVGLKQPNAWDLDDMHGNVMEWCWDNFDFTYYTYSPSVDPTGPETSEYRSVRGGGWWTGAGDCRSASRDYRRPQVINPYIGLRIVRNGP